MLWEQRARQYDKFNFQFRSVTEGCWPADGRQNRTSCRRRNVISQTGDCVAACTGASHLLISSFFAAPDTAVSSTNHDVYVVVIRFMTTKLPQQLQPVDLQRLTINQLDLYCWSLYCAKYVHKIITVYYWNVVDSHNRDLLLHNRPQLTPCLRQSVICCHINPDQNQA